jgi:hypothetical protein
LVVAEVAAAVVMTIGAGLFIRSAIGLAEIEWGFDTDDVSVVTFRVRTGASMLPFSETVIERVRLLPFVEAVSAGTTAPIVAPETFFLSEAMMERVLADSSAVLSSVVASRSVITRDYFRALGVDVRGREFDERDVAGALPTVILSETLARRVFSDREPIGQRVHFLRLRDGVSALESNGSVSAERLTVGGSFDLADFVVPGTTVHTVIGVAQDVKMTGDTEGPLGGPRVYLDYRQAGAEVRIGEVDVGGSVNVPTTFVLRTKGDPQTALEAVKSIMVEADPRVELREAAPVQSLIFGALDGGGRMRLMLILSSVFGFLAVVLSAAGVYGALSQRVSQRTHEIGVRMALGARPWGVLRMILVQGLRMTAIGLVLGLVGAWVASRSLEAMLFGVTATDILTYAIMTLILLGVAAGASMVPALRASRVDPMLALRHE